jgi:hypothetical protein
MRIKTLCVESRFADDHRLLAHSFVLIRILALLSFLPLMTGCSVMMAWKQPTIKDLSVLGPGTDRDVLVAQLGPPVSSEKIDNGQMKEIFAFVQGYSPTSLEMRGYLHATADVLSLGLWEIAGTPLEAHFDGKLITVSVDFDSQKRVVSTKTLSVTDPHPTEFATIRDTIFGDSDTPKYTYVPTPGSALIVSAGDPVPDEGDAPVVVAKVDGYFAKIDAADPQVFRFLRSKQPLYLSSGNHALTIRLFGSEDLDPYTDGQGGTVSGLEEIEATDVIKVEFLPNHIYRFVASYSNRVFRVDLWDVTSGAATRTRVGNWVDTGQVTAVRTSYAPPPGS